MTFSLFLWKSWESIKHGTFATPGMGRGRTNIRSIHHPIWEAYWFLSELSMTSLIFSHNIMKLIKDAFFKKRFRPLAGNCCHTRDWGGGGGGNRWGPYLYNHPIGYNRILICIHNILLFMVLIYAHIHSYTIIYIYLYIYSLSIHIYIYILFFI